MSENVRVKKTRKTNWWLNPIQAHPKPKYQCWGCGSQVPLWPYGKPCLYYITMYQNHEQPTLGEPIQYPGQMCGCSPHMSHSPSWYIMCGHFQINMIGCHHLAWRYCIKKLLVGWHLSREHKQTSTPNMPQATWLSLETLVSWMKT